MFKYRKKPVEIEAVQYTGDVLTTKCPSDFTHAYNNGILKEENGILYIETSEGKMKAEKGDYIIKDVNGEFHSCNPDIFEKTYEEVSQVISIVNNITVNGNVDAEQLAKDIEEAINRNFELVKS